MKGSVIINGVDIADFGAFILRGGDHEILTMPERTEPTKNNWHERNGLDVDLSEAFFKARTLPIQFYISADNARDYEYKLSEFYRLIAPDYITMYSREFDRTFKYRYLSVTEYNHKGGLYKAGDKRGAFTVSFSMDDPLQLFRDPTILQPRKFGSLLATETALLLTDSGLFIDLGDAWATRQHITHVSLNGIDLGAFGIIVNECYSSMLQLPAVKAPLTQSFNRRSGLLAYPSQSPTFEAKEIVIKCTMVADSRAEFYYNYEALFNNLTLPRAIELDSYLGHTQCYYSKMEGFKKMGVFSRGVMVGFTLRLIQVDPAFTFYVLGSASDTAILTDVNEFILYQN